MLAIRRFVLGKVCAAGIGKAGCLWPKRTVPYQFYAMPNQPASFFEKNNDANKIVWVTSPP